MTLALLSAAAAPAAALAPATEAAPEVKPDEVKYDKPAGKGQSKAVQTPQAASDAQWLQNLTTSPAKFLQQKFRIQDQAGQP